MTRVQIRPEFRKSQIALISLGFYLLSLPGYGNFAFIKLSSPMQNTRISTLFDNIASGLDRFFRNPWRRFSLLLISLLLGNFLGTAISTISGQRADLDIVTSALLVAATEVINRLAYSTPSATARSLPVQTLNATKLGLIYSLFVEAFKLGS